MQQHHANDYTHIPIQIIAAAVHNSNQDVATYAKDLKTEYSLGSSSAQGSAADAVELSTQLSVTQHQRQ